MSKILFDLPLKTVSEVNSCEHWTAKHKRHKQQQAFVRMFYASKLSDVKLPCKVTFTRLSPRSIDSDNLPTCFKYIRDELSELLNPEKDFYEKWIKNKNYRGLKGHADSTTEITWIYSQQKSKNIGVRIEIDF